MKYWSKTALLMYNYLDRMSQTIDKLVLDTGKYSNNPILQRNQTTYYQAGKIIELMDRKRKMINLRITVEDSLAALNQEDRRILVLVFLDGVKSEVVAERLGVSLRTFFRKKVKALERFNHKMIFLGFDLKFFESEYSSERWMLSVYDDVLIKYNRTEEYLNNGLVKRFLNELTQINVNSKNYLS